MQPTVGRIVFYAHGPASDQFCPAIVTRVYSPTCVNLRLFPDAFADGIGSETRTSVIQTDGAAPAVGGWFWPPRV